MTRTFEIVKELVDSMDLTIKVDSIDGNTLNVCKTLHVRNASIVTDSLGQEYRVLSFENNESIEIEPLGAYTFEGNVVNAPKPVFLQGKWISANEEYLQMSASTRDKTPLIWLVRGYRETHNGVMNSVKLEVEPIIYFLDEADFTNWINEDHDKEAINPMFNLATHFVQTIEKNNLFKRLDSWSIEDEPRFGVRISNNKGNSERILSDDLSGVGLRLNLNYFGKNECKC
jgi:hypothetical protein